MLGASLLAASGVASLIGGAHAQAAAALGGALPPAALLTLEQNAPLAWLAVLAPCVALLGARLVREWRAAPNS